MKHAINLCGVDVTEHRDVFHMKIITRFCSYE